MNKLMFTIVAILILNVVPLLWAPDLLLHYKTIIIVICAASLWLSQPAFSTEDANENKASDKSSILVILFMSSLSVVASMVEWAYFTDTSTSVSFLNILGLLMLGGGIFVRVWAIITLGKNFTATAKITESHQFITSGPYKLIRHPSYLGAFLAITGCPVFLNAPVSVIISIVAMSIAYYIRITHEESMLSAFFGDSYKQYMKQTKMIIPYIL